LILPRKALSQTATVDFGSFVVHPHKANVFVRVVAVANQLRNGYFWLDWYTHEMKASTTKVNAGGNILLSHINHDNETLTR